MRGGGGGTVAKRLAGRNTKHSEPLSTSSTHKFPFEKVVRISQQIASGSCLVSENMHSNTSRSKEKIRDTKKCFFSFECCDSTPCAHTTHG